MSRAQSTHLSRKPFAVPDLPALRPVCYRGQTYPLPRSNNSSNASSQSSYSKPAFIRFPLPTPPQSAPTTPLELRSPSSQSTLESMDFSTSSSSKPSTYQPATSPYQPVYSYVSASTDSQTTSISTDKSKSSIPRNRPSPSVSTHSQSRTTTSSSRALSPKTLPTDNTPDCTCPTSCALHNGMWELLRRRGSDMFHERIWEAEEAVRLAERYGEEVSEESLEIMLPSIQEVAVRLVQDGWNLKSVVWKWG